MRYTSANAIMIGKADVSQFYITKLKREKIGRVGRPASI
jgi:hypothetical protein